MSRARQGLWAKWANEIARYPLIAGLAALAILIPLTIPLLSLNLGQQDIAALSTSTTARKAYDLLAKSFGAGHQRPAARLRDARLAGQGAPPAGSSARVLGLEKARRRASQRATARGGSSASGTARLIEQSSQPQSDPRTADPRLATLQKDISATPGVAAVTPAQIDKAGTTAFFNAVSTQGPAEEATTEPRGKAALERDSGGGEGHGHEGGRRRQHGRLHRSRLADLGKAAAADPGGDPLSFVLLILAFRTAVIPAQAAVMNLLSIGASYGVLTAIFQYGWLASVIGLSGSVPIVSYVPLFMFAVLFGLSMDYEVFLVSQIEEHVHAGEDNRSSVVSGLVTSARVITAAALIMVFVFGSFVLNGDPTIKQFGVGLAVAVVLDATVVRCLLVPALMLLMGKVNWWMPGWLERVVPHVSIEGGEFFARATAPGTESLEDDLGADEVRGEALLAKHVNLPDVRARADVQRLAERRQQIALGRRGEHVDLQLDGREALALGQVAHRSPGGDGVGECDPGATVHVAHRVQLTLVDEHSPAHVRVGYLRQLDAEIAGKRAGEHLAAELRRDRKIGLSDTAAESVRRGRERAGGEAPRRSADEQSARAAAGALVLDTPRSARAPRARRRGRRARARAHPRRARLGRRRRRHARGVRRRRR